MTLRPVAGRRGILDPADAWAEVRSGPPWVAPTTLLSAEDTANTGGGSVYPLSTLDELGRGAWERDLHTHLDGARLFNAVVESGVPAERRCRHWESVAFCLSKGLGAPAGSVLCGPADFILRGRRLRKMLGGAMRQAGYLAAAGLYALEHNVERLAGDHRRARALYEGLLGTGWAAEAPETNMVYVRGDGASATVEALAERGVLAVPVGPGRMRLVTHLDIDDDAVEQVIEVFRGLR